jgi:hypothetical protein
MATEFFKLKSRKKQTQEKELGSTNEAQTVGRTEFTITSAPLLALSMTPKNKMI